MAEHEGEGWARWLPALVPLGLAGVLTIGFGADRGALLAAIGVIFGVLISLGIPVQRGIATAVDAVVRGLAVVIGTVLFVLLVIPGWLWAKVRRHDPLDPVGVDGPAWSVVRRSDPSAAARHLGAPAVEGAPRASVGGRLIAGIGVATVIVVANYGIGWAWDEATDVEADAVSSLTPDVDDAPVYTGPVRYDPRADEPAMAAYPWRDQYFADIQKTLGGYWPYTEGRPYPFESEYVNFDGWVRRSYRTPGDAESRPTVWMFGGSTTWGEGQRDEYTIASHLARLAEADGVPIEISNYGQRGWVHFQEMILFEQQIDQLGAPDLAVFCDGANEITSQSLIEEPVPTHTMTYAFAEKLYGTRITTSVTGAADSLGTWGAFTAAYQEHSAIHKVLSRFGVTAAGAAPAQEAPESDAGADDDGGGGGEGFEDGFTGGQEVGADGNIYNYDLTDQDGIDAGRVYERGKLLTTTIAEKAGVKPIFFWQPMRYEGSPQELAIAQLSDSTIDISDSLVGHDDVFIDGGHTNEEGARIVAEAIWEHLRPEVEAWYQEN